MSTLFAVETSKLAHNIVAYFELTRTTDTGRVTLFEGHGAACVVAGARPQDVAYAIGREAPTVCVTVALAGGDANINNGGAAGRGEPTGLPDGASHALVAAAEWHPADDGVPCGGAGFRGERPGLFPDLVVAHDMPEVTTSRSIVYEMVNTSLLYLAPHEVAAVVVESEDTLAQAVVEIAAYADALVELSRPSPATHQADALAADLTTRLGLSATQSARLRTVARGAAARAGSVPELSRPAPPATAEERRRAFEAILAALQRSPETW
mgnify:FL=1